MSVMIEGGSACGVSGGRSHKMEGKAERVRTGGVGEEHDQPVDADAPPAGGRETVLEAIRGAVQQHAPVTKQEKKHSRVDERLVDVLSLVVALVLLPHLWQIKVK